MGRPRILVSACLLGERTRYDGETKRHPLVAALPVERVVAVCPEVECGLAVPREPIQIEQLGERSRLVAIRSREDLTDRMARWCDRRIACLPDDGVVGCILKSRSPSCGLTAVPRFRPGGDQPVGHGRGVFAEALVTGRPDLLLLEDDAIDEDVLDRFFAILGLKSYK